MQVLFDVLRAGRRSSLVFLQRSLVYAWVREAEVQRTREGLPHLAPEPVGQSDLDETRALWVTQKGEVAAVRCK